MSDGAAGSSPGVGVGSQSLEGLFGQLDQLIAAAVTLEQRRSAWTARDRITAGLLRKGWLTREIAQILGRSQSTVNTWAARGRPGPAEGIQLPLPLEARPELTSVDDFVGVTVAAELLGVNKHTIRNWIHTGRLSARRPAAGSGTSWRIALRDIQALAVTPHCESVRELAEWYCVAEQTIRRWIRTGRLAAEQSAGRGVYASRSGAPSSG